MTQPDPNREAAIEAGADALFPEDVPALREIALKQAKAVIDAAIAEGTLQLAGYEEYLLKRNGELGAEVERLRDAIRRHREAEYEFDPHEYPGLKVTDSEDNRKLWAALEGGDTPP